MVLDANFLSCFTDVKMPHQMEDVNHLMSMSKQPQVSLSLRTDEGNPHDTTLLPQHQPIRSVSCDSPSLTWLFKMLCQTGVLWQSRKVGWGWRWEERSGRRGHECTYGWLLLMCDRKPQNSIKQLSFNQKKNKVIKKKQKKCFAKTLQGAQEFLGSEPPCMALQ